MNFEEHAAKPLLRAAGIRVPEGAVARSASEAARIAADLGPCVVKAQVAAGKRGKAGGVRRAATPQEAEAAARAILGVTIGGLRVEKLLVEAQIAIAREMYAAVLNDPASRGPLLLFAPHGGVDVEEIAAAYPDALLRLPIDIRHGITPERLEGFLGPTLPCARGLLVDLLRKLYDVYADADAELLEINPLAVAADGQLIALDCKLVVDDAALGRQGELASRGSREPATALEARAAELGLKFIELEGEVGVLANGAGLTMTTMDAVRYFGGSPANFLEIGGESYTKAKPALELVLANPRVKCLLVNFCGAFARTDVMAEGVLTAWLELQPKVPVFFTVHGTGEDDAVAMIKERLGVTPFDRMDDAVKAAVAAARGRP